MPNTVIVINLKNLKRNFLNIRKKAGNRKVMAVVKADSYGHGMAECVKALASLKKMSPDYYGVAMVEEGIELRKLTGVKAPVLCFAPLQIEDIPKFQKYDIIPSFSDLSQVEELLKLKLKKQLKIHINIDTGMGLTGIPYYQVVEVIALLSSKKELVIDGLYSIFPSADKKDKTFSKLQVNRIKEILHTLKLLKINYGLFHAANSAALLNLPEGYFDMVRTGSSMYGFYPSEESSKSIKLFPVLSLYSRIEVVKRLKKGESIGFGRGFTAPEDINIATIPIGYADGFKRAFSNRFCAIIRGKYYPQIGNVAMDRIAFNLENDKILKGEKVVLMGQGGKKQITLADWGRMLNSIPYEVSCTLGHRIPRIYKG